MIICVWLLLYLISSGDPELAVIIGGINGDNNYTYNEVEVFQYVDGWQFNCSDNTIPQVPNFPVAVSEASAVYLENIGIYVCGGSNGQTDCYKYDPRQNRR